MEAELAAHADKEAAAADERAREKAAAEAAEAEAAALAAADAEPSQWLHTVPLDDGLSASDRKSALKEWFTGTLCPDGITATDDGNFCIHVHNAAKGQYFLGVVFKAKMTVHSTVIAGEDSKIGNKNYYDFTSVNQMVRMLSNEADMGNLNMKWPIMLKNGWINAGAWEPADADA